MNGIEDSLRKLDADDSHQWAVLQSLGPCLDASSLLLMGYPPFLPFTLVSVCSHSLDPALDETRMGYEELEFGCGCADRGGGFGLGCVVGTN